MDPSGEKTSGKVLVWAYIAGVVLAAGTELAVIFQRGPGIYVSTLWAGLYPAQLLIADLSSKLAYTLHFYLRNQIATATGVTVSSLLFGIIPLALTRLTQWRSRSARYIGFGGLGALIVMSLLWGTFPRVI